VGGPVEQRALPARRRRRDERRRPTQRAVSPAGGGAPGPAVVLSAPA